jgi:DNA end-binding protein Ku
MYQHGHEVVIQPYGKGMLLTWMRPYNQVTQVGDIFKGIPGGKQDQELIDVASMLIDKKLTTFDPSRFEDRYEEALAELIDAKRKGKELPKPKAPPKPENVVNLADILKKSLTAEGLVPRKRGKSSKKSKAA